MKNFQSFPRIQSKQLGTTIKKDCKIIFWFEVEDTGCGIDPSKWEAVFESFEQADPSTTRTHGGTGLGLCIVRTLVNKMGGEIKVVNKDGPGTLMRLSLIFNTPGYEIGKIDEKTLSHLNVKVLLALNGIMGRCIMSKWLRNSGVCTWEVSEWNELTQILQEVFPERSSKKVEGRFVIVIDIGLLDLNTSIWKEQLKFLEIYKTRAKFAWILNHDTCNSIKMDLRRKGHLLMVNKPLYKTKMVQIMDSVSKEINVGEECLEIDYEATSSDESDGVTFTTPCQTWQCNNNKRVIELSRVGFTGPQYALKSEDGRGKRELLGEEKLLQGLNV